MSETESALRFRNGHVVTFDLDHSDGSQLRMHHSWPRPGRLAGPHWHPVLHETFTVVRGSVRFRLDGEERLAGSGDVVEVPPHRVHEFWSLAPDLEMDHLVRPPLHHREMFELWHELDSAGRTSSTGMPYRPLDVARLWALQDGYLARVPAWLQRLLLGGLSRWAARRAGVRG